jgi:hypothetical protein
MDLLTGRSNKWNYTAQFFTPWPVASAMAQMSGAGELEARFHGEVKRLLADDPVLQAMTLTASMTGQGAFWWWLSKAWPFLKPKIDPVTVCDPCVGSGILLLAHAACHPLWLAQIGYVSIRLTTLSKSACRCVLYTACKTSIGYFTRSAMPTPLASAAASTWRCSGGTSAAYTASSHSSLHKMAKLAWVYLPREYGVSCAPYIVWQFSLHSLVTFPTWLGSSPYTAWQSSLHRMAEPHLHEIEYARFFGNIFCLQVFLQISLRLLLQGFPYTGVAETTFYQEHHSPFLEFNYS